MVGLSLDSQSIEHSYAQIYHLEIHVRLIAGSLNITNQV